MSFVLRTQGDVSHTIIVLQCILFSYFNALGKKKKQTIPLSFTTSVFNTDFSIQLLPF